MKRSKAAESNTFLSRFLLGVVFEEVVVVFTQLQEGAGVLDRDNLHSFQTPDMDRQVSKVGT